MRQTRRNSPFLKPLLLAVWASGLLGVGSAQAALLGVLPGYPDIRTNNMALTYEATSDTFTMTNTASTTYELVASSGGTPVSLSATDYDFTATVNEFGNFSGGSLSILDGATTLLDATVGAFGWEFIDIPGLPTTGKFDAEFVINAADPSLGFGTDGVMLASFDLQLTADAADPWATDFTSADIDTGLVDTAGPGTVPEPSTLSLLVFAVLGAMGFRRRRA